MKLKKERLKTFKNVKFPNILDLVECGFYYTGSEDYVICFSCGFVIPALQPYANPFKSHSSTCTLLPQPDLKPEITVVEKNSSENCCLICFDFKKNILFLPCKHFLSCERCAQRVKTCPVCRTKLTFYFKIYPM